MLAGVPVLAADSGGPLETVVEGETGWLRDVGRVDGWTEVMREALEDGRERKLEAMGRRGRERVRKEFSEVRMAGRLEGEIERLGSGQRGRERVLEVWDVMLGIGGLAAVVVAIGAVWALGIARGA